MFIIKSCLEFWRRSAQSQAFLNITAVNQAD